MFATMTFARTKPLLDRPYALAMGPQKAGTSWLDRYLRWHGQVCLPREVKEIFFFDRHYDRGADFYASHFKAKARHDWVMEVSTTAFDCEHAPQRVKNMFGADVTLLCPLRHPVTRSYSLYHHYLRYGIARGTLPEAVAQIPQIVTSSHYADHLIRWADMFGMDNITLLYQEELKADQESYLKRACAALKIEARTPPSKIARNYNGAGAARHPALARAAQNVGDFLRDRQLYSVVNAGKSLGLRTFIFGAKTHPDPCKDDDLAWLAERLSPEAKKLETMLGHKIDLWHE